MKNQIAKIAFIIALYKTSQTEIRRLKNEIINLGFQDFKIYFIDNSENNQGYAQGVNEGIKQALFDNCELLIVANPDISLRNLKANDLLKGGEHFDIWGLAMKMHNKIYYGGEIDKVKLSGGLIREKPNKRFVERDFVSGSIMFLKKNVIEKVGLFNEEYFMYYEDVDYCLRARQKGLRVGIDSKVFYEHFENSKNNPQKDILLRKAHDIFFDKCANIWQRIYRFWTSQNDKRGRGFLVNFFSLNFSSLINKILNFILFILMIRYLDPKNYGIYTLVWAQISLFSPIVDLGTTSYGIVNLPSKNKAKFVSLFNLRLFVSLIVFILTVLTGYFIFKGNNQLIKYILLTSFIIFSNMLSGSYLIKNAVEGKLINSSVVSVLFNVVLIFALSVSVIIFRSLPLIFLLIFIFYNLYSFLNYYLVRRNFKHFLFTIDLPQWKRFLAKSYIYILISFFAGIYFKIDIFLLQFFKGETAVGVYSAGYKFFEALIFLAASYNISRTPMFAKIIKKGLNFLTKTMKKDILFLGSGGFAIAGFFYFLSPLILPIFLKANFQPSITVLRLVIFALPFILISSVFLNALYVLKKAYLVFLVFVAQSIINLILNLIFIPRFSFIASSYITVISEMVNTLILVLLFFKIKNNYHENIA